MLDLAASLTYVARLRVDRNAGSARDHLQPVHSRLGVRVVSDDDAANRDCRLIFQDGLRRMETLRTLRGTAVTPAPSHAGLAGCVLDGRIQSAFGCKDPKRAEGHIA